MPSHHHQSVNVDSQKHFATANPTHQRSIGPQSRGEQLNKRVPKGEKAKKSMQQIIATQAFVATDVSNKRRNSSAVLSQKDSVPIGPQKSKIQTQANKKFEVEENSPEMDNIQAFNPETQEEEENKSTISSDFVESKPSTDNRPVAEIFKERI